jgi:SAM-dependent methyltransferase
VIDAPSGYGRNALALAARGCTVIAIDRDPIPLTALQSENVDFALPEFGRIVPVCANLTPAGWPLAPSSASAIVCVHFPVVDLIPNFIASLKPGGCLYIETVGGQGGNFLELPKAGQVQSLLRDHMTVKYYAEREVGPGECGTVSVVLLARR